MLRAIGISRIIGVLVASVLVFLLLSSLLGTVHGWGPACVPRLGDDTTPTSTGWQNYDHGYGWPLTYRTLMVRGCPAAPTQEVWNAGALVLDWLVALGLVVGALAAATAYRRPRRTGT